MSNVLDDKGKHSPLQQSRANIVLFNNQTLKNRGEAQTNAVDRFLLRPPPTVMTTIIKATMEGRNHIKPPKLQGVKSAMLRMTA